MNEVTTIDVQEAEAVATAPESSFPMMRIPNTTPMQLLAGALERGAGLEMVEKLMGLQDRWEAIQARKAFDEAMAAAKAEIPPIIKNRRVGYESKNKDSRTDYKHEDLAEIARTIDPILAKHGLSYRWKVSSALNQPITVTCVVSHRLGYSEENSLMAGADNGAGKNSIQAIGSTITYLQRYTLKASLGLAASNDDDGKTSTVEEASKNIDEKQIETLTKLLANKGRTTEQLCKVFNIEHLSELPTRSYPAALEKIATAQPIAKKDAAA